MDGSRFDGLSRALGSRVTRRRAVGGGAGLAAAAVGAAATRRGLVRAQDATPTAGTPAASIDGSPPQEFLFVQTFSAGSFLPKEGTTGAYTLTLTGDAAQTVYFSDRPDRIVGTVPTVTFLQNLGFTPANPPNAAIVTQGESGEDVVVVELTNAVYTEAFGDGGGVTVTYDATVLDGYTESGLAFLAAKQTDASLPETLGATSLFIDDCPDQFYNCYTPASFIACVPLGGVEGGQCWSWLALNCVGCTDTGAACNAQYSECNGTCFAKSMADAQSQGCG